MNIDVSRFTPGDEAELLDRGLRAADILEAWKVTGMAADKAVRLSLEGSLMVGTIRINSQVAALFGVAGRGILLHTGIPWLVAHPDFERPAAAVPMARIIRRFLAHWLTVFPRLENVADPGHANALRVLSWCGFSMTEALFTGPLGHRLIHFWKDNGQGRDSAPRSGASEGLPRAAICERRDSAPRSGASEGLPRAAIYEKPDSAPRSGQFCRKAKLVGGSGATPPEGRAAGRGETTSEALPHAAIYERRNSHVLQPRQI